MFYELGKIPYIDSKRPANEARRHRPVYLRSRGSEYVVQVEGYSAGELPKPQRDFEKALVAARKFIHRNNGSCYKRPVPAGVGYEVGRRILDSTPPERRGERDSGGRNSGGRNDNRR